MHQRDAFERIDNDDFSIFSTFPFSPLWRPSLYSRVKQITTASWREKGRASGLFFIAGMLRSRCRRSSRCGDDSDDIDIIYSTRGCNLTSKDVVERDPPAASVRSDIYMHRRGKRHNVSFWLRAVRTSSMKRRQSTRRRMMRSGILYEGIGLFSRGGVRRCAASRYAHASI